MIEDKTDKVLKGQKIYPYIDGKVIRVCAIYDLREHFKRILKEKDKLLKENGYNDITNFLQFNRLLREDIKFLNIIKNYFNDFDDSYILISDKDIDSMFVVKLLGKETNKYTLRLVETYCSLNKEHFFEDYIDVFGNKIEFR